MLWQGPMWGGIDQTIVGYGDFCDTNSRGETVEWFMVGLAAQEDPSRSTSTPVTRTATLVRKHADHLGKVKVGSAVIGSNGWRM